MPKILNFRLPNVVFSKAKKFFNRIDHCYLPKSYNKFPLLSLVKTSLEFNWMAWLKLIKILINSKIINILVKFEKIFK